MTRRLLATVALIVLATACGSDDGENASPDPTATVTVHYGDQLHVQETLLRASGQLDNLPYKIEFNSFPSGPPLLEAINANAVDVGLVGDTPPIFAQSAGSAIKVVAATHAKDPNTSALAVIVPKDSPIKSLADLKDKRVAYTQGSAAHYLVLNALKQGGLTTGDITVAQLQPPDALAAFTGGDVDAWATWDPYIALAEQQQDARVLAFGVGLSPGLGFAVARPGALDDPNVSAAIGDILRRLAEAQAWSLDHQDEWAAQYAELTKLPLEVVTAGLSRRQTVYGPIDDSIVKSQQEEADAFADAGLIPNRIDVTQVFDNRYTDQLRKAGQ